MYLAIVWLFLKDGNQLPFACHTSFLLTQECLIMRNWKTNQQSQSINQFPPQPTSISTMRASYVIRYLIRYDFPNWKEILVLYMQYRLTTYSFPLWLTVNVLFALRGAYMLECIRHLGWLPQERRRNSAIRAFKKKKAATGHILQIFISANLFFFAISLFCKLIKNKKIWPWQFPKI